MPYPELPFADYTWRISHHQGVLTAHFLHTLLWAASTYQASRDPAEEITNYLVANPMVPPNIRTDSRRADIWRDYQQLLSELGLMYSTRSRQDSGIRLTQAGIAYLDGSITFTDLMTAQALRFQYPNGHHRQKSPGDASALNFAEQQQIAEVAVRPAAALWHLLDGLFSIGEAAQLSSNEIEHFAIPLTSMDDVPLALQQLRLFRHNPQSLVITKRRRNASDWIKRLAQTALFESGDGTLTFSDYSLSNRLHIRELLFTQEARDPYWTYPRGDDPAVAWANWYGTLSADFMLDETESNDFGAAPEENEEDGVREAQGVTRTAGRPFDFAMMERDQPTGDERISISSVYDAALSNSAHRQHDAMLRLIAETCRRKNAEVLSDPSTFDLLIRFPNGELLIEVKSASARNLHSKVRTAVGQVSYYDFLRSTETELPRRRAIALTLGLPDDHWAGEFLSDFMDIDLITLREGRLHTRSTSADVTDLLN